MPVRIGWPLVRTKSVRFRTAAGATIALVVLLALAGLAINWFVGRQVQQSFDQTLLEQAVDRATLVSEGASIDSLTTAVGAEELVAAIDGSGTVIASSGLAVTGSLADLQPGVSTVVVSYTEPGEGTEQETLRVAVADASNGTRIVVANEGETIKRTRAAVRSILLAIIPLTALAGAMVAWFVTGRALEPVKTMRDELDDVVSASAGHRVTEPGTGDEIHELAGTINGVLDRLDEQSVVQRRFIADASHELKSPLANARAIIETASPATDSVTDTSEYARVTSSVGLQLNRLHALVDDLLYLARGDEGAPRRHETVDLADLTFDECERIAASSEKRIDAANVVPVSVTVDPAEITRAIRNLLENAERFAVDQVRLSIVESERTATLVVADDGPGIAVQDRERVFERFSRLDSERARAAGGTGLGLSIVASLAARNGGAIRLTESASGGAQFELELPRSATA